MEMETIVSKMGLPEPENEAQLRKLGRIGDPDQRTEAYVAPPFGGRQIGNSFQYRHSEPEDEGQLTGL